MGSFKVGQVKPEGSGRKKGTPNRRTIMLRGLHESLDFDVPKKLIELLPLLSHEKQADVLLELMPYLYPKRKALENTEEDVRVHDPSYERFLKIQSMTQEERRAKLKEMNRLLELTKDDEPSSEPVGTRVK